MKIQIIVAIDPQYNYTKVPNKELIDFGVEFF
jgi:hypothetical protein